MNALHHYREVWMVDFEFTIPAGHKPTPLCVVARELRSGRLVREWLDDPFDSAPYPTGPDVLLVAFYAPAEWGCHLALGWPTPLRILDLYAEFACLTSGTPPPNGRGLLGALGFYGLPAIDAVEKDTMRDLAIRGGPYSDDERAALLDYCQTDVDSLARLLPAMLPHIDLPRALLRGRYTVAVARMEAHGTPIDTDTLTQLRDNWTPIKSRLITEVNASYGVYVPAGRDIDPTTRLGSEIFATARAFEIDPYTLADATDQLWQEERERIAETADAVRHARDATGLSARRMRQLEESGQDHASVPGLDSQARELAGMYPELRIGRGYDDSWGDDSDDNAALLFERLRDPDVKLRPRHELVREAAERLTIDGPEGVGSYMGPMRFSSTRFAEYLIRLAIPWPRLEGGELDLKEDTFKEMARAYPAKIGPLRDLRHALGQLKLNELAVGADGRNRAMLTPFGSLTGRNQPSNSKFIFGPSCWLRSLIQPGPGRAVAYVDWSAQELGIAAALSGDPRMQEAYASGDPYLWFGKHAKLLPADATKKTHGSNRDQLKVVMLGVLYGLSEIGLARRLAVSQAHGRELLQLHRQTFRQFWQWSDGVQDKAILSGRLSTAFGWRVNVSENTKATSLRNFPMQAHGAEMMRIAACLATERGIGVCAPVHDAFLVEAAAQEIDAETDRMKAAMREASEVVLPGFPLRTDAKIVQHPDRFTDARGVGMWRTVTGILEGLNLCQI